MAPRSEAIPRTLEDLAQPHIESFDYFLGDGMKSLVEDLHPVQVLHHGSKSHSKFWISKLSVLKPMKEESASSIADPRLLPRECRESGTTYRAPLVLSLSWGDQESNQKQTITKRVGQIPIMVKSHACYLRHMKRDDLIRCKEEGTEFGGYFICNGIERVIRMLIVARRHYIMGLKRNAYKKRGPSFTEYATTIRCVRRDESSMTNRCHYLADGSIVFALSINKSEYFIPAGLLLKCLGEISDREIYNKVVGSVAAEAGHRGFIAERIEVVLKTNSKYSLLSQRECLEYIGSMFRSVLDTSDMYTSFEIGCLLISDYLFIHLDNFSDKLQLVYQMIVKLYSLVNGQCVEDNPDALTHQEVLLPGHLLLKFMREQLEICLQTLKSQIQKDMDTSGVVNIYDESYMRKNIDHWPDIGQKFEYLLNTGNMSSRSGLDLSQSTGFTVVAEKLNFHRYLSHFRSIHRGAYFAELRTTVVRKLLPESWGFMCPVHTPDGSPCGLLNHLTSSCVVIPSDPSGHGMMNEGTLAVKHVMRMLGMVDIEPEDPIPQNFLQVLLDGRVIGILPSNLADTSISHLRSIKASKVALEIGLVSGAKVQSLHDNEKMIPSHLEIAYFPLQQGGVYPGIFMFTHAARLMRPVKQVGKKAIEMIGTLEQCSLSIKCPDGEHGGSASLSFTHEELSPQKMLSVVASLTPYSDFNQSPRNMYQCQMAKQTMGTAAQSISHRNDNKLYRLQTPQSPIVRTDQYSRYAMDEFPSGTNAIVAVLAYTGYDMEDAMILNKSSVERGFAHASLYKSEHINLSKEKGCSLKFGMTGRERHSKEHPIGAFGDMYPRIASVQKDQNAGPQMSSCVDSDGLSKCGVPVWPGNTYYSAVDQLTNKSRLGKLKGEETAVVDQVAIIGHGKERNITRANIKLRFNRNPVIGDKFSSRHGQKGVLSRLYDDIDMPFSESTGMRPDLLINPHAFPSRMTIGMLIESLTGKTGCVLGEFVDASPFKFAELGNHSASKETVFEEFCGSLESAGFSRSGGELMICGVSGEIFQVETFVGAVYYQRLRHMVSDKFQVRSTGPVNPLTRQPIKGRKFGGGIRFGEMERDSLLAHGAAYLLHDRLHSCSDYYVTDVCSQCGLLISTMTVPHAATAASGVYATKIDSNTGKGSVTCSLCESGSFVERVAVPYVFKYLVSELAAMNIRCSLDLK